MKRTAKFFLGSLLTTMLVATGCGPVSNDSTTNPTQDSTSDVSSTTEIIEESTTEIQESTSESSSSENENIFDQFDCITITKAIEIATAAGENESEPYYVYGTIKAINNPQYGEMTLTDGTSDLYVYGVNDYSTMEDKPLKDDEVVLFGSLKMYNGSPEMGRADLKAFKKAEKAPIDESNYTEMSVKQARESAPGTLVKMTGVVASITLTQGKVPNGFILVDDSESIYVYGKDAVQEVSKGKTATILAKRVNYISDKEANSAKQFGYQGCIQVDEVSVVSVGETKDVPTAWIKETTVKEILDTPLTNNITSSLYKVHAFVHKEDGSGFINYYIDDLDDKTGTYVYTSNSGSDFAWLDPFDNKLCDLILSPLNVKCSSGKYNYRFHPISCSESNYVVPESDFPAFALNYYVKDQFLDEYNANPNIELITSATNPKIGMGEVKIEYLSNNTDILSFDKDTTTGKVTLKTNKNGTATITMKATYGEHVSEATKQIVVNIITVEGAIGVKAAIDTPDNTMIKIKGIVLSSLVNRTGFYLVDETGIIAITSDAETISSLRPGNLVYFEGFKTHYKKDAEKPDLGQIVIDDAKLLLNSFGSYEYPTDSFILDKTFADLKAFDACADDVTAQAFRVDAKILVEEAQYYTNINLADPSNDKSTIRLYCSSGKQYGFLKQFANKVVTLELALCNWNNKTYYTACAISATDGTTKAMNTLNFGI